MAKELRVIAPIVPAGDFEVANAKDIKAGDKHLDVALAEAAAEVAKKANKTDVNNELNKKASTEYVNAELSKKADKTDVAAELVTKANKIDTETALAEKASAEGLASANEAIADLSTEQAALSARMDTFKKLSEEKLFLGAFFDGDNTSHLNFYLTYDLVNYAKLDINAGDAVMRDASLFEDNGIVYFAYTAGDSESDFTIAETSDFVNFTKTKVNLGLDKNRNRWAPSITRLNGKIMLTISSRTTSDSYIYMCEFDVASKTYSGLKRLVLNDSNLIDSELFEYNNSYYLLAKSETEIATKLYKSADLNSFAYVRTLSELPGGLNRTEGAFALNLVDKLFIGADNYNSPTYSRSQALGFFTRNIEESSMGNLFTLNANNQLLRHGSVIAIKDYNLRASLQAKSYTIPASGEKRYVAQELKYYADENGVIDKLYVFPNVIYRVSGSEKFTINRLYNPFGAENFLIQFRANVRSAWINIVNNGDSVINCKVINSEHVNEKIVEFKWTKNGFYLCNNYEPPLMYTGTLSVGTNTISPVMNNEVYLINRDGNYTVNVSNRNVSDLYIHTGDKTIMGILTFDGNVIDMSTLPAKCVLHFVKYGESYMITGVTNITKNTIVSALNYNPLSDNDYYKQSGGKNILNFKEMKQVTSGSIQFTKTDTDISVESTGSFSSVAYALPQLVAGKTYKLSFKISNYSSTGGVVKVRIAKQSGGADTVVDANITQEGNYNVTFTAPNSTIYLLFYPNYSNVAQTNTYTASEVMIKDNAVGDDVYVPYIPTNAELYELIKSLMS